MPSQNRPASKEQAPDPATTYERAKPEKESTTGKLDNVKVPPAKSEDRHNQAAHNRKPSRQINTHEDVNQRRQSDPNDNS